MCFIRLIIANLCPNMIHVYTLDISKCRSEEVMLLLMVSGESIKSKLKVRHWLLVAGWGDALHGDHRTQHGREEFLHQAGSSNSSRGSARMLRPSRVCLHWSPGCHIHQVSLFVCLIVYLFVFNPFLGNWWNTGIARGGGAQGGPWPPVDRRVKKNS